MSEYYVRVAHDGIVSDNTTQGAVQFNANGRREWIPRSQLEDYRDDWMEIPRWLAEARELDYEEIDKSAKVAWKR